MMFNNIYKSIKNADVISFDVFDTLLIRPYVKPTDLFTHMEKHFDKPFFAACRINAETNARKKLTNKQDITFKDIYEEIDDNFKSMKQSELDWEEMVLRPNPQILDIWDTAKKLGKKIVIASDMYLPQKFIAKVLKKNGFNGYDKLYVSGDFNITKCHGTMFDKIITDMQISPNKILHIGDNKHCDYVVPRSKGIHAIKIEKITEKFIKQNPRIQKFWDSQYHDLGASILVSVLALRNSQNRDTDYWHNLGYEYGGPVMYGYTRWIQSIAHNENIEHLFFVARDGYTLQKIFNTFDDSITNSYVYAPRFLNLIYRLDYFKYDIKQSSAIVDFFANKNHEIQKLKEQKKLATWLDYHKFIQDNKRLFIKVSSKERINYKQYLSQNKNYNKIAIVDTITGRFSSQKLIQSVLEKPVSAFYWSVLQLPYQGAYDFKTFCINKEADWAADAPNVFTKNWNFMEFLMTSPEYPIHNIKKGKPVYEHNPSPQEKIRHDIYPNISKGALNFTKDIKKLFNNADIYLTNTILIKWVNCFCDIPTKQDFNMLSIINHAGDSRHMDYHPLFCTKIPLFIALTHPKQSLEIISNCIWRSKLQSIMLIIFKPLSIKMHGIQTIRILFFPKLKWRYLSFILRFGRKCFYVFSIGKPQKI